MAYEFKSLGTVDVVETVTDTANVLIEEDGVIKRAPKSEVGGNVSGGEPDMVLEISNYSGSDVSSGVELADRFTVRSGDINNVIDKVNNYLPPRIVVFYSFDYAGDIYKGVVNMNVSSISPDRVSVVLHSGRYGDYGNDNRRLTVTINTSNIVTWATVTSI